MAEDTRTLGEGKPFGLVLINGPDKEISSRENRRIDLTRRRIVIGSSDSCDVILRDDRVDSRHAFLRVENHRVIAGDLDSSTGTRVNNQKLVQRRILRHMDQITVGGSSFLFIDPAYPFDPDSLEDFFDESLPEVRRDFEFKIKPCSFLESKPRKTCDTSSYLPSMPEFIDILSQMASGYSLPMLLDKILGLIFDQFPADRGFILLYDPETEQFIPVATRSHLAQDQERKDSRLAISRSLLNQVWKEREAILIQDLSGLGDGVKSASMIFHRFTSIMCAPLIFNNQFLGALQVDAMEGQTSFRQADLEKILAYCHAAAIAIANTRMREQLKEEEQIRHSLSRYLPNKLIEQVVRGGTIPPGGAEAEVAIMFVDIRGFTAMCEQIPPKDIIEVLNEFHDQSSDSIFEYSGMITQFVGDGIICIFGGPWIADSDYNPCDSAVSAARDIVRKLIELNKTRMERKKESILVGIGIDYGRVLVGNIGTAKKFEFTAIGRCVNRASRLCQMAKPSQIIISSDVMERTSGEFKSEPLPPVKAKNISEPIPVFRVFWNR